MTEVSCLFALSPHTLIDGRYEVLCVLGIGGFAVTYQGVDRLLGGYVAIKEYFPQSCAQRVPGGSQ